MYVQIPGFNMYLIDEQGNVVSMLWGKWKPKALKLNKEGYYSVSLKSDEGDYKHKLVHRLVMSTFKGASDLVVNHLDGNKANNNLDNLEYCTVLQNARHAWETGLHEQTRQSARERANAGLFGDNKGENHYNAKLTQEQIDLIRELKPTHTAGKLASIFNVSASHIYKVWSKQKWS